MMWRVGGSMQKVAASQVNLYVPSWCLIMTFCLEIAWLRPTPLNHHNWFFVRDLEVYLCSGSRLQRSWSSPARNNPTMGTGYRRLFTDVMKIAQMSVFHSAVWLFFPTSPIRLQVLWDASSLSCQLWFCPISESMFSHFIRPQKLWTGHVENWELILPVYASEG